MQLITWRKNNRGPVLGKYGKICHVLLLISETFKTLDYVSTLLSLLGHLFGCVLVICSQYLAQVLHLQYCECILCHLGSKWPFQCYKWYTLSNFKIRCDLYLKRGTIKREFFPCNIADCNICDT